MDEKMKVCDANFQFDKAQYSSGTGRRYSTSFLKDSPEIHSGGKRHSRKQSLGYMMQATYSVTPSYCSSPTLHPSTGPAA